MNIIYFAIVFLSVCKVHSHFSFNSECRTLWKLQNFNEKVNNMPSTPFCQQKWHNTKALNHVPSTPLDICGCVWVPSIGSIHHQVQIWNTKALFHQLAWQQWSNHPLIMFFNWLYKLFWDMWLQNDVPKLLSAQITPVTFKDASHPQPLPRKLTLQTAGTLRMKHKY